MQPLGPWLNVIKAFFWHVSPFPPGNHRSGINDSGFEKYCGFRCIAHGLTDTYVYEIIFVSMWDIRSLQRELQQLLHLREALHEQVPRPEQMKVAVLGRLERDCNRESTFVNDAIKKWKTRHGYIGYVVQGLEWASHLMNEFFPNLWLLQQVSHRECGRACTCFKPRHPTLGQTCNIVQKQHRIHYQVFFFEPFSGQRVHGFK